MMYNAFYVMLDSVYLYFLEDFSIYLNKGYWSVVFLLWLFLVLVSG